MLEALVRNGPDALVVVDPEGRIVMANAQAERLFGYGGGALVGLDVEALMPEAQRAQHRRHRATYMGMPHARPMGQGAPPLTGRRRDGSEFAVEIALSPIETGDGFRYLAAIRDVSHSQRALQGEARARYDALVARIGQMVLAAPDEDAVVARLPAELCDALAADALAILSVHTGQGRVDLREAVGLDEGLREEPPWTLAEGNMLCRSFSARAPVIVDELPDDSPALARAGFRSSVLVPLLGRNRPMGALVALSREPAAFGHDAVHCLQSVANLLAALIQRRRTEEQLAHAQRLEAIGQLTGGIAHDFNNMLTVVSGNLQLLELRCGAAEDARELIDAALHAVRHGAELTGKLLAFARRQRLSPRAVAPAPLLKDIGILLRHTLGELVQVEIDCPADLPPVYADASQLEAALINLAVNARDAMPRGGRLCFAAATCGLDEEAAEDLDLPPGGYVRFTVADTGHGMTPDVLARAFEPFFTTKAIGKGSGLGLSMAYGFARQSGGQMRIESRLGYGTRAELYLPLASMASEARPAAPTAIRSVGGESLLVVEDDPAVSDIAVGFLRSLGYAAQAVATAGDALRRLAEDPAIALLFTDVVLGSGMSGTELAQAARRLRPGLPVLLASGYETPGMTADDAGAMREFTLLRKPYRREELAAAVRRQLDRAE